VCGGGFVRYKQSWSTLQYGTSFSIILGDGIGQYPMIRVPVMIMFKKFFAYGILMVEGRFTF